MNHRVLSFIFLFEIYISTSNQELYNSTTIISKSRNKFSFPFNTTQNIEKNLSNTTPVRPILRTTYSKLKSHKKWEIERITRKQYEILNLLRQKTKIFIDLDYSDYTCKTTTTEMAPEFVDFTPILQKTFKSSILMSKLLTSTASYIEFYYLDSSDDKAKYKNTSVLFSHKAKNQNQSNSNIFIWGKSYFPSLFKIRINTIPRKHRLMEFERLKSFHKIGRSTFKPNKTKTVIFFTKALTTINTKTKFTSSIRTNNNAIKKSPTTSDNILNKRNTKESFGRKSDSSLNMSLKSRNWNNKTTTRSTIYDKVKFFEIYDSNTLEWQKDIQKKESAETYDEETELSIFTHSGKIHLQHVNEDIGHQHDKNKTRYVKKHIQKLFGREVQDEKETDNFTYFSRGNLNFSTRTRESIPFQRHSNRSRLTAWTKLPFVAVYIYEPLQVRCDAASINPHWLLAAASCLSRYRREFHGGSLSAFVTFCSDNWRQPNCMSYVKRTIIHPRYHPRDRVRRHLYNVGVIQIVNSMMATCNGWTPVALMSHHFTTGQEGSLASAVGWGLDRYVKMSTVAEIPNHSLMTYESLVYSESCPGSFEYSNAKASDEDGAKNVFCLSLPPYVAEENDTVHGALLLIGGKLLALYLQEERRPWGVQSAQYTGLWRLVPWLIDTAREPDDFHTFQFHI